MQLANRSCGCLLGLPAERRQPLRAITCNSAAAARRASHFAPSSMHGVSRRSPSRASTEALPGGFEHLLADSALPILKICGLSAVGAYCAQQVCSGWSLHAVVSVFKRTIFKATTYLSTRFGSSPCSTASTPAKIVLAQTKLGNPIQKSLETSRVQSSSASEVQLSLCAICRG